MQSPTDYPKWRALCGVLAGLAFLLSSSLSLLWAVAPAVAAPTNSHIIYVNKSAAGADSGTN